MKEAVCKVWKTDYEFDIYADYVWDHWEERNEHRLRVEGVIDNWMGLPLKMLHGNEILNLHFSRTANIVEENGVLVSVDFPDINLWRKQGELYKKHGLADELATKITTFLKEECAKHIVWWTKQDPNWWASMKLRAEIDRENSDIGELEEMIKSHKEYIAYLRNKIIELERTHDGETKR